MSNRAKWTPRDISFAKGIVSEKVSVRVKEKGWLSFASRHEILGILEEELLELKEAVRVHKGGRHAVEDELEDIAVAAILGLASMKHLDW